MDSYAHEKLWMAVDTLVTGTGSIRVRLIDATMGLTVLNAGDFPPGLREEFTSLMKELTCKPAKGNEGRIVATVRGFRNEKAAGYARRISDLCYKVTELREADS